MTSFSFSKNICLAAIIKVLHTWALIVAYKFRSCQLWFEHSWIVNICNCFSPDGFYWNYFYICVYHPAGAWRQKNSRYLGTCNFCLPYNWMIWKTNPLKHLLFLWSEAVMICVNNKPLCTEWRVRRNYPSADYT